METHGLQSSTPSRQMPGSSSQVKSPDLRLTLEKRRPYQCQVSHEEESDT